MLLKSLKFVVGEIEFEDVQHSAIISISELNQLIFSGLKSFDGVDGSCSVGAMISCRGDPM
jgi:hypothetical protein